MSALSSSPPSLPPMVTTTYTYPSVPPLLLSHVPLLDDTAGNPNALTGLSVWKSTGLVLEVLPSLLPPSGPLSPARVLELGCGTGLTALFLLHYLRAQLPASHVHVTDGDPKVVELLRSNILQNDLLDDPRHTFSLGELIWGGPLPEGVGGDYGLVFGCDLLYSFGSAYKPNSENNCVGGESGGADGLFSTVRELLRAPAAGFVEPESGPANGDPADEEYEHPTWEATAGYDGGYFLLGITRRSVPIDLVIGSMRKAGLV